MLTPELITFLDGPNTVLVATRDGEGIPDCTVSLGVRCAPDGSTVMVFLPAALAAPLQAHLQADDRIAVVCSRPSTHQGYQLKGHARAVHPVPDEARGQLDEAFERFIAECALVGLPRRLLDQVVRWPVLAIVMQVTEVYDQTPGPGAGERWVPCP